MRIRNASVYTEEGKFEPKDIFIKDAFFADCDAERGEEQVIDASGCVAIPGLTDIHFHGCMGHDF